MKMQLYQSTSQDLISIVISHETSIENYELSQLFDILSKEFAAKANNQTGVVNGGDQTRLGEAETGSNSGGSP